MDEAFKDAIRTVAQGLLDSESPIAEGTFVVGDDDEDVVIVRVIRRQPNKRGGRLNVGLGAYISLQPPGNACAVCRGTGRLDQ